MTEYERPKYTEIRYKGEGTEIPEGYDYLQLKMDGMYGNFEVAYGKWSITSRTGKIKAEGEWPNEEDEFILTGEYMKGSHWAKRNGMNENVFYAFDCYKLQGSDSRDRDYYYREQYMRKAVRIARDRILGFKDNPDYDMGNIPTISKVRTWGSEGWYGVWREWVVNKGYEGLVFKNSYKKVNEKNSMARMKKTIEMDYICIGFEPASEESKYKGLVGGVKGTLIDKDIVVECGGLTDKQRHEYTANAENYIGKIFTAKGNDWFPSGSIRHPKFREWREDKTHYECSYIQVPEEIRDED
jgi:ATP-dependent DNA ligase